MKQPLSLHSRRSNDMKYARKRKNGRIDFEVYHFVYETAIEIFKEVFEASKGFPGKKMYLAAQMRKHSKQVCINLAEAWHLQKHNNPVFLTKLSDAAHAASKTQSCLELASRYNFIDKLCFRRLDTKYEDIFELLCDGKKRSNGRKTNKTPFKAGQKNRS
jgi:four helix bundle protein